MGNSETENPSKADKESSPVQEQASIHPHPDWSSMQAYYGVGPGVSLPPPYFASHVASGHAPHPYMWGPQPMMSPYGAPYAAIYPHGGVYTHPSVPIMASPLNIDAHAKSSVSKDRGLMKKLKSFDGLAVSIGNGNAEHASEEAVRGASPSGECGTEGSTDGSDGNTAQGERETKKKKSEGNQVTGIAPAATMPGMEFRGPTGIKINPTAANVPLTTGAMVPTRDRLPTEIWMQNPQAERELKRERRKQSNRESARRSRLRKQAESEELAIKVESLNAENMTLRSEMNRLTENFEQLRREKAALTEKLKNAQQRQTEEEAPDRMETESGSSVAVENFLTRMNNSSSISRGGQGEKENHDKSSSGKLHQLLESKSMADAVAAG